MGGRHRSGVSLIGGRYPPCGTSIEIYLGFLAWLLSGGSESKVLGRIARCFATSRCCSYLLLAATTLAILSDCFLGAGAGCGTSAIDDW